MSQSAADNLFPEESLANPAIARCARAWSSTYRVNISIGSSKVSASLEAGEAFRKAMPALTSADNVRDFVACVASGLLISAISSGDAARLLYAAQVAQRAFPRPSAPPQTNP